MAELILALRSQRQDVLDYCRGITGGEWDAPSCAEGWRVRDVIAHMGATCRVLFSPSIIGVLRTSDAERDNDVMVDRRRDWPIGAVLGEFSRWSAAAAVAATACARGLPARIVAPYGGDRTTSEGTLCLATST